MLCITYGRPAYLEQAVRWFEAQTWPHKEMVVVDDSPPKLRADLRRHGLVKHIHLDAPMNMGDKHNLAVREAQGEVFAYQDDDDYFGPRRLITQLEPIVLEQATITGFVRDYVVRLNEGCTYWKFLAKERRPRSELWLTTGLGKYNLGLHDGTAMFARSVLRHGIVHPPYRVRQKVYFLQALTEAGEKWRDLPAKEHFIYVRHDKNTWEFRQDLVLYPVAAPRWVPKDVSDFWRREAV